MKREKLFFPVKVNSESQTFCCGEKQLSQKPGVAGGTSLFPGDF